MPINTSSSGESDQQEAISLFMQEGFDTLVSQQPVPPFIPPRVLPALRITAIQFAIGKFNGLVASVSEQLLALQAILLVVLGTPRNHFRWV